MIEKTEESRPEDTNYTPIKGSVFINETNEDEDDDKEVLASDD